MKSAVVWTLLAMSILFGASALAQEQKTATLDLKKVYDNYAPFQQAYEAMKKEVEAAAEDLKLRAAVIESDRKQLAELPKDDPGYKDLEAKIADDREQLSELAWTHKTTFARREAQLYAEAYRAIFKQLDAYCQANKIDVLMRPNRGQFAEDQATSSDPKTVAEQLNRPVLYTSPRLDITDDFLKFLNREPAKEPPSEKADRR